MARGGHGSSEKPRRYQECTEDGIVMFRLRPVRTTATIALLVLGAARAAIAAEARHLACPAPAHHCTTPAVARCCCPDGGNAAAGAATISPIFKVGAGRAPLPALAPPKPLPPERSAIRVCRSSPRAPTDIPIVTANLRL